MSNLAHVAQQHGTLQFAPWLSEPSICDTTSPEALEFLTPRIGPGSAVLLQFLARRLQPPVTATTYELGDLSQALGGGTNVDSRSARIIRLLVRLEQFGYLTHDGFGHCQVRMRIPPLGQRHIARLTDELRHRLANYQQVL